MCAKRTMKNFAYVKVVLPMIFMPLGCTMVTRRSETLLYINTSYNCPRTCLWIVYQMAYFLIPDAILFEFSLFLGNSTRVWRTDRPMDGPTDTPSYRDAKTHLKTEEETGKTKNWKDSAKKGSLFGQITTGIKDLVTGLSRAHPFLQTYRLRTKNSYSK